MSQIFFSTDIESNGPIPGSYSMLSFGSAAYDEEGNLLDTFYVNLDPLPDATEHSATMEFWSKNQEAYNQTRVNTISPKEAMIKFTNWVNTTCGKNKPVFVAFPAGFDFMFVYWYLIYFTDNSPFSFSALDMKTFASAVLKKPFRESGKKNWPKRWFSNRPHTHNGLDDALEQGESYIKMMKENLS